MIPHGSLARLDLPTNNSALYGGPRKRAVVVSDDHWNFDTNWPTFAVIPRTTHPSARGAILGSIRSPASDVSQSPNPCPGFLDCLQVLPCIKSPQNQMVLCAIPKKRMRQVGKRL